MSAVASQVGFPEPVFRLSVKQYHAMIAAGVLSDDDPVELLEGVLVFKLPKNPPHRVAVAKLRRAIEKLLPCEFSLQVQEPITLGDSEPEPDAAVIRGQPEDYPDRHPSASETLLVIEVADSTLGRDRGIKLRSYARAKIEQYWIVNLAEAQVEIYSEPDAMASPPAYRSRRWVKRDGDIELVVGSQSVGALRVGSILP